MGLFSRGVVGWLTFRVSNESFLRYLLRPNYSSTPFAHGLQLPQLSLIGPCNRARELWKEWCECTGTNCKMYAFFFFTAQGLQNVTGTSLADFRTRTQYERQRRTKRLAEKLGQRVYRRNGWMDGGGCQWGVLAAASRM